MYIKLWSNVKKQYKLKMIKQNRENGGVTVVVDLLEYKRGNPTIEISLIDMLLDKGKREATYTKYDKNYQSTKEEDEIFNEMRWHFREEDSWDSYTIAKKEDVMNGIRRTNKKYKKAMTNLAK